jgi:hypothetical protein
VSWTAQPRASTAVTRREVAGDRRLAVSSAQAANKNPGDPSLGFRPVLQHLAACELVGQSQEVPALQIMHRDVEQLVHERGDVRALEEVDAGPASREELGCAPRKILRGDLAALVKRGG